MHIRIQNLEIIIDYLINLVKILSRKNKNTSAVTFLKISRVSDHPFKVRIKRVENIFFKYLENNVFNTNCFDL